MKVSIAGWDGVPEIMESVRLLTHEADLSKDNSSKVAERLLDGEVSTALRKSIDIEERRRLGIFPTGSVLRSAALDLLQGLWHEASVVVDPTCGPGDLLIEAMRRIVAARPSVSLKQLQDSVRGQELVSQLAELARARLLLQAKILNVDVSESSADEFANIKTGDFLQDKSCLQGADVVLLNPPFTKTAIDQQAWATGSVTSAAVFCLEAIRGLRPGGHVLCILPDVLRSGSRYSKWRAEVASLLNIKAVLLCGQFDDVADVHVFVLHGQVRAARAKAEWPYAETIGKRLSDFFLVNVGTVVPHRSLEDSSLAPYVCAKTLLGIKKIETSALPKRSFGDKKFSPPFVVVRRTSRPGDSKRARATIVTGPDEVLVENHLIVLRPKSGLKSDCEALAEALSRSSTSEALDTTIRCRHLTTASLKDLAWENQA